MFLFIFAAAVFAGALHAALAALFTVMAFQTPARKFVHAIVKMHCGTYACGAVD